MTEAEVLARLAVLAEPVLGAGATADTPLDALDSLDRVDLVCAAEDAFEVRIPDDDAERFATFGEVARFIAAARG